MNISNIDFSKINLPDPDNLIIHYYYPEWLKDRSEEEKKSWTHKQEQLGIINRMVEKMAQKKYKKNYKTIYNETLFEVLQTLVNNNK